MPSRGLPRKPGRKDWRRPYGSFRRPWTKPAPPCKRLKPHGHECTRPEICLPTKILSDFHVNDNKHSLNFLSSEGGYSRAYARRSRDTRMFLAPSVLAHAPSKKTAVEWGPGHLPQLQEAKFAARMHPNNGWEHCTAACRPPSLPPSSIAQLKRTSKQARALAAESLTNLIRVSP